MSEGDFRYHAGKDKNDYGNWVRDVMGGCDAGQAAREECYTVLVIRFHRLSGGRCDMAG